jgi:PhnB protein
VGTITFSLNDVDRSDMTKVSTYLNFQDRTEEAMGFYATLFGGHQLGPFARFSDMADSGGPQLSAEESGKIMHMEIELPGGHVLMATDMLASMGHTTRIGNNTTIMVELESREDVDRIYSALESDNDEKQAPQPMPWGQYWCTVLDGYGIRWMLASA